MIHRRVSAPAAHLYLSAAATFGIATWLLFCTTAVAVEMGQPCPGTKPLTWEGDIASRMVAGIDRFLLERLKQSEAGRESHWARDRTSAERYRKSLEPNRQRLARIIGAVDDRTPYEAPELLSTTKHSSLLAHGPNYTALAIRWPVMGTIRGEGLLLRPDEKTALGIDVVVLPDADQTPEQIAGLADGLPPELQYARRLAESGCRVIVPALVSRTLNKRRHATLTNREFVYRPAFELGRHIIGYEVQTALAALDWLVQDAPEHPKAIFGWGEGGLLALYAGALDSRFDAVGVSGYFNDRTNVWREPVDRNVFGLLEQFGDAELAAMIAPRCLVVEAARAPQVVIAPGQGGAPGAIETPQLEDVRRTFQRGIELVGNADFTRNFHLIVSGPQGQGPYGRRDTLGALLKGCGVDVEIPPPGEPPTATGPLADSRRRQQRLIEQFDRFTQNLLREGPYVRKAFFNRLDTSSLERFGETIEWYRDYFANEVVGRFALERLPFHARSRKVFDQPKYEGFEVVLDVFPDVFAYGILLVPKDIAPGERRPVVVCQHGLESRPQHVAHPNVNHPAYGQFACRLAEEGFITFAPQNPYIFGDRFRTLQRKANPLKKTLFSIIVPQHEQITDWLASLPIVDAERIAFYGLSYGGKTAMRVPPLVRRYCLSICSADFNDWVWKNASTRSPYSYVWTSEYEIFEFDLGSTFNYSEMAALIAPRPFMVERGHFDSVAPDERVAYEYAKVRHLYAARLGIGDRTTIEWFVGPHKINAVGTFAFLHNHLNWPKPD